MKNWGTPQHNPLHTVNTRPTTDPLGRGLYPNRSRGKLVPILIVSSALLVSAILVLANASLSAFLSSSHFGSNVHSAIAPLNAIVGHVYFSSSGQIHEDTSQGIADEIDLELSHIPDPAVGKSYYAWLLNDDSVEGKALLLGRLVVNHGMVHLHYPGDQQHTNLLEVADRLLITEEDANTIPGMPSLDRSTWHYIAQFPQTPNPLDTVHHFNLLSHLRHLLASDPTLKALGMPGGLEIWLFRNVQKVLEWSGSARDDWRRQDTMLMHRHFIRILDYLDGLSYVQNDVPPDSPVLVNPQIARVALLEIDVQHQQPPGLLYHIGLHLQGLVASPGATLEQKQLAIQIDTASSKVQAQLVEIQKDAKQLVMMTNEQLLQPSSLSLLDDMVKHAQDAFIGQFDPTTGEIQNGVTQIHYTIQRLAMLNVNIANEANSRVTSRGSST